MQLSVATQVVRALPAILSRTPSGDDASVQKLKLLIAEDSPQMRRLMRTFLSDLSSEIVECTSGNEAVRLYFRVNPDWVLMDLHMQDGDGLHATREIRRLDENARIVIVTQFDEDALRQEAARAGAVAYMLKENLLRVRDLLTGR